MFRNLCVRLVNILINPSITLKRKVRFKVNFETKMEAKPLVSIVLPVYNHGKFVGDSIESILKQEYKNFELIIVDDGSTDDTAQVLSLYSANKKVKLIKQENAGLPTALNAGFSCVSGSLLTWTSADNLMAPQALEILVRKLLENEGVGLVYSDYTAIDEHGNELSRSSSWRNYDRISVDPSIVKLGKPKVLYKNIPSNFIGPYFLYRASVAKPLNGYANTPGIEDWDFWMRLQLITKFKHVKSNGKQYSYRVHSESMSHQIKSRKQMSETIYLLRRISRKRVLTRDLAIKIGPEISELCFYELSKSKSREN
jgi:glycosyltransferase involved in cell wall biosynthesis